MYFRHANLNLEFHLFICKNARIVLLYNSQKTLLKWKNKTTAIDCEYVAGKMCVSMANKYTVKWWFATVSKYEFVKTTKQQNGIADCSCKTTVCCVEFVILLCMLDALRRSCAAVGTSTVNIFTAEHPSVSRSLCLLEWVYGLKTN